MSRAVELDPVSPAIFKDKGLVHYYSREYDRAIEMARKALALDPGFATVHRILSLAYAAKQMFDEAIGANTRWQLLTGHEFEGTLALAQLYAASGKPEEAREMCTRLESALPPNGLAFRGLALVYAALGEKDTAFRWLEKGYEARDGVDVHDHRGGSKYSYSGLPRVRRASGLYPRRSKSDGNATGPHTASEMHPLSERQNKLDFAKIAVHPGDSVPPIPDGAAGQIERAAERIAAARRQGRPVVLTFGAHLIKNGLAPVLTRLMEEGWVTHIATNGAGSIHDWEFAYQGLSAEDVRENTADGRFGIWEEDWLLHQPCAGCRRTGGPGLWAVRGPDDHRNC